MHGTTTMLRPCRSEGSEERNSRTSTTTRGGCAVAASRPPPAIRVFTVRRNASSALPLPGSGAPCASVVITTAMEARSLIRRAKASFSRRTDARYRCSSTEPP